MKKSAAKDKKQWMSKELTNLATKKNKAWNIYLGVKSFSNWTFYEKICHSMTNVVKIAKINFKYRLVHCMRLIAIWKYVRSTQKTKENVADLRTCKKGIYAKTSARKTISYTVFCLISY